jgi:hypothetical protein
MANPRGPHSVLVASAVTLCAFVPAPARADHYEAQWSARPVVAIAALREGSADQLAFAGGLSVGMSYGVSDHLDLGAELLTLTTAMTSFHGAGVIVDGGAPYEGPLARRTESALLLLGPTWRFGTSWVPVVSVAVGGGIRHRSDGTLTAFDYMPSDRRAMTGLDLAASVRAGIEHRINRRLTAGGYLSALGSWGPSLPALPAATLSFGLSYVHYPLW